ncbi:MAG TPA: hypothetical protein VGW38_05870 [Chloroflexota bacterium]|nr:hypothetical protein [Chloroflexota bacterium]
MQTPNESEREETVGMVSERELVAPQPSTERPSGSPTPSSTASDQTAQTEGAFGARAAGVTTNPHRFSRRPAPSDASRRAEVQQHLDARTTRLQEYVTSLEVALDAHPSGEQEAQLQRRLAQGRRDLDASVRSRMPAQGLLRKAGTPESATSSGGGAAAPQTVTRNKLFP